MATYAFNDQTAARDTARVYCICIFERSLEVPRVSLFDADTDAQAINAARSMCHFAECEIWDRHRLVAVIPAAS